MSTMMIDAPGFALLFSLCVDYTTYDDYRSGVFELIVQAGLPLREYPTAKLWFYEAVSSAFLLVSPVAGLAVDHWQPSDMPVTVMRLLMAFVPNGAWAALGTQLAICLRLLNPDSALYLTPLALAPPVFANVALWHLVDPVLALTVSSIVAALCGAGAFAITARVLRGRFIPTLRSDAAMGWRRRVCPSRWNMSRSGTAGAKPCWMTFPSRFPKASRWPSSAITAWARRRCSNSLRDCCVHEADAASSTACSYRRCGMCS